MKLYQIHIKQMVEEGEMVYPLVIVKCIEAGSFASVMSMASYLIESQGISHIESIEITEKENQ